MPTYLRLDEFGNGADAVSDARDRSRYSLVGFDLQSAAGGAQNAGQTGIPDDCGDVAGPSYTLPVQAVTDQQILNEIQYHFVETPDNGATVSSGLWTVDELVQYLNLRQYDFLKRTGLIIRRRCVTLPNGVARVDLPAGYILLHGVTWRDIDPTRRVYRDLPPGDYFSVDQGRSDWEYNQSPYRPEIYILADIAQKQLGIAPVCQTTNELLLTLTELSTLLSNTGQQFTVPPEFVPGIKYGAMADALAKPGRGQDIERAQYCLSRYEESVEAAELLLNGLL